MPETLEYTLSHRMIATATRLREAWSMPVLDLVEMHAAALELMSVTRTTDLASALVVLHEIESDHTS